MGAIICVPDPYDGTSLLGTSDMDEILNSFSSEGKGNILNEAKVQKFPLVPLLINLACSIPFSLF